jgi:hypothetical protein
MWVLEKRNECSQSTILQNTGLGDSDEKAKREGGQGGRPKDGHKTLFASCGINSATMRKTVRKIPAKKWC